MELLQIENSPTLMSMLISAILAESGVIIFLFAYIRTLQKTVQEIYREQLKESKEMIEKNTAAFVKHTEAVEDSAQASVELREAFVELKLWLRENTRIINGHQ